MFKVLTIGLCLSVFLGLAQPVSAVELYADEQLTFENDEPLNNAYLAGQEVKVTSPVTNDLVVAGSEIEIDSAIEGGLLAAAGNLELRGTIGRSARIAAGEAVINGEVQQDLVVLAGKVIIGRDAKVVGDVVFTGGELIVNGAIEGSLLLNCQCDVTINGTVGEVDAEQVGRLTVGQSASINGSLNYSSVREADIDRQATVSGQIDYNPSTTSRSMAEEFRSMSFFYGMISSLIFALVLLWLFRMVPEASIAAVRQNVLLSFGIGMAVLIGLPIVAFASFLISVWLGLSLLLLYMLLFVVGFGLAQLILGWWLLQWWFGRTQQGYELDWRAAVIGVLATTILILAQVIGWFIFFLAMLLALGGLAQSMWRLRLPLES